MRKGVRKFLAALTIAVISAFAGAYFGGWFNKPSVSVSPTIKNDSTIVDGGQYVAGNDIEVTDNRKKVEVNDGGAAFFDSSKQVNTYNSAVIQRRIDKALMAKIMDSIPSKEVLIEIECAGGMEGENLGREMKKYLSKKGYTQIVLIPAALTGDYEKISYLMRQDGAFSIIIHPRANVEPIQ